MTGSEISSKPVGENVYHRQEITNFYLEMSVFKKYKSDPVTGPVWPGGWVEVQLYSSMTAALEGSEWSAARPGRNLSPGKTRYPFHRRLGWPQGRSGRAENLVPTGICSRTVQPVAQSLYQLSYPAIQMSVIMEGIIWSDGRKNCFSHVASIHNNKFVVVS